MREHAVVPRVRPQPIAVELRDTGQEGQGFESGPGSSQHGRGQRVGNVRRAVGFPLYRPIGSGQRLVIEQSTDLLIGRRCSPGQRSWQATT